MTIRRGAGAVALFIAAAVIWPLDALVRRSPGAAINVGAEEGTLDAASVLLDGWVNGHCVKDTLLAGGVSYDLDDVGRFGEGPGCPPEVVAFASGFGVSSSAAPAWFSSAAGTTLNIRMGGPLVIPLNVWVVTSGADAETAEDGNAAAGAGPGQATPPRVQWAMNDVDRANQIFYDNAVGIEFHAEFMSVTPQSPEGKAIGSGCESSQAIRRFRPATSTPAPWLYRPGALNVYYVPSISLPGTAKGYHGYYCDWYGGDDIVFVSHEDRTPVTLAHELGHALGLQVPGSGHVGDAYNVMVDGVDDRGSEVSIGQAYRINIDSRSWLNRQPGSRRPLGSLVRTCQYYMGDTSPCPRLLFPH